MNTAYYYNPCGKARKLPQDLKKRNGLLLHQSQDIARLRALTQMNARRNVVLYLDQELVSKSRQLGFNLSKTFENHLKTADNAILKR